MITNSPMNIRTDTIMHPRNEKTNEPKRKTTSSINTHQRYRQHHCRDTLRRTYSHGLPSLATNTVQMVVATLQLTSNQSDNNDEKHSNSNFEHRNLTTMDDDNDVVVVDDDDETIVHLGQEVQAHLPDIVLHNLDELIDHNGEIRIPNEHRYDNGTLLFLDVSGFTALTEQYSNDAHLGIDQLTRTLNSYFDKLVVEILIHDGDIYKFAGDAILALWIDDQTGPQRALECALNLQEKCGAYQTDVGVILHLKVALAYGPVRALFVGTDEFKHYLLTGDCVSQVNYCEQLCEAGDIIISPQIYQRLDLNSFQCEFIVVRNEEQQEHILVKRTLTSIVNNNELSSLTNSNELMEMNNGDGLDADVVIDELNEKKHSLMKSFLLHCVYQRIERQQSLHYLSELRRVTISFINLDISNDKTIEKNLHLELQKIFVHIYEQTKMMGGVLTKALLFDKGWSFLCVFGLPGYKQGDDTANALKSAQMIHSTIVDQSPYVQQCSIGVTTGLTYCGVVGHPMRCEYTVIGRKVNLAARLMCNYLNVISCDQETFYNSRLNKTFFQILPDKILKGMNNVGLIWQYGENSIRCENKETTNHFRQSYHEIQREDYPILGRRLELMIVTTQLILLDEPIDSPNRRRDLAAIIFEGEDKIGRTRLLQFIGTCLENGNHLNNPSFISHYENTYIPHETTINRFSSPFSLNDSSTSGLSSYANDLTTIRRTSIQVINYRCQFEQRFNEFGLLRALLRQLFQFHQNDKTEFEREQYLLRLFDINKANDLHLRRNLYLLNDFLDVRFRRSCLDTETNLVETYENHLNELLLHILNKLIDSSNQIADSYTTSNEIFGNVSSQCRTSCESTTFFTVSKIIFLIDDIHFADEASLKYLLTLGSHRRSLLILSMKPPTNNNNDRPNSNTLQSIRTDSRVYRRRLNGLDPRFLTTLACQILSVHRLPSKLVQVLIENCNGIPGFCEQILFDLLSKEKIYIVNETSLSMNSIDQYLIEGDAEKLLSNISSRHSLVKSFFPRRKLFVTDEQRKNESAFSRQCLLKNPSDNDFNADFEQNFQNYIMCRIDRLSEGESLLVKIAAVIGNTFSRMFLWHLVDPPSKKLININSCIMDMMGRMVIECAYGKLLTNKTRSIKCYCRSNPAGFPSSCRLLAFTHSTIREGIYNSLTDSLKRSLIRNAIDYLERHATVVCLTCGANRHESPVLVHNDDGLAKIVKNRQQHAFVDIVRMAALKEIDDTIKDLAHAADSLGKPSTNPLTGSSSAPLESPTIDRNGSVPMNLISTENDERLEVKVHPDGSRRNSSDPNLTLISVFSTDGTKPIQVNVQRSSSAVTTRTSQLFSLFKLPKRSTAGGEILQSVDGLVKNENPSKENDIVQATKNQKRNRILAFFRFIFCQFVPIAPSTVSVENEISIEPVNQRVSIHSVEAPANRMLPANSYWRKVRKAILPSREKPFCSMPDENDLIRESIFSVESMSNFAENLHLLTKHIEQTRTFENLYHQSFSFHQYQSFPQWNKLIQYVFETRSNDEQISVDLNQFATDFNAYNDLRTCECADYVITVYMKLIEYHQNLYEIYEKISENLRMKQFDRLMFYRIEICQVLLRCNCFQRLLIEIENGRKSLRKFRDENEIFDDSFANYQCVFLESQWNLYQAIVLQRTRAINEAKQICEENLQLLNKYHQEKIWEKLPMTNESSAKERRQQFEQSKESPTKEFSGEFQMITQSTNSFNSEQVLIFAEKYRLEYLLCQYHFLQYELNHQHSVEPLLQFDYFQFPLAFSLRCTVVLVEHFYCQMNYDECLHLIDQLINFWWPFVHPREKLELAKLKCLSLIIELKRGQFESAILSGYFAKRILTGYHENVFLIESCIYLSFALIGEMRLANIEAILQHLKYLSEQTMNCYAKLWYYVLVIDVALELGYELLPLNVDLLDHIVKYRKRLLSGSNQRSLALFYSDCVLSQIYARLGLIDTSKIHFHYVFHQLKFDSIHLSNIDFRFKRALLKLSEIQLIHWYHLKDDEQMNYLKKDSFLLNYFHSENNEEFLSWNKTRFGIYRAYYDRLINVYQREKNLPIDNDYHWQEILDEIEGNAIELDRLWIDQLRQSWSRPVSEQILHVRRQPSFSNRTSFNEIVRKSSSRRCIRPLIPPVKHRLSKSEKILDENSIYSHQTFINWRLTLNPHHSTTFFQLYLLPVKV